MRYRFERSFDDSLTALENKSRSKARRAVARLLDYFDGGPRPQGLGLRQLSKPYWEARIDLDRRIVFSLEKDLATFILVGNHDEVRRFLGRL